MAATIPGSRFVWHELETVDPSAGISFYRKTVGWTEQSWNHDPSYRMLAAGKTGVAGVMMLNDDALAMGAVPAWLGYISVANVDDAVRRSEKLGGRTIVAPEDIEHVGRFAVLTDPLGAMFAVFTPLPMQGGGPSDSAGLLDFSWHELGTNDWRRAWDFYRTLFGWEEHETADMGPQGIYFMFRSPGTSRALGGMFTLPPGMNQPPAWLPYVRVQDADAVAGLVAKHGGAVKMGPMDIPGGDRIAVCTDLHGAAFVVHTLAADRKQHALARHPSRTAKKPAAKRPAAKKPAAKKPAKQQTKRAAPKKQTARTAARKTVKKRK